MSNKNLSEQESALFYYFYHEVGLDKDVPIAVIHDKLYGNVERDHKTKQQYIGSIVSKVNRKTDGYRIRPGEVKRTYRLVTARAA